MQSRREQVLEAVKALIVAALPDADVERNPAKAVRIGGGGTVAIRDGEPGEPEVDLSPLTYRYEHRIPLELVAYESATKTREQVIDDMLMAIGAGVEADRTLGGLCEWVEPEAPDTDDVEVAGAAAARSADAAIIAVYSTPNPLS